MSQVMQKSGLTVDGNHLNMSMPFSKVDVSKRTVSGYATLDNIDTQGDLVTAESSVKAFSRARGNLREMHDKVAVGKVLDFQEQEFFDKNTGELYRGIYVTAYISKGAESTWEKVLDGTLSGFSIGGEINDSTSQFVKDAGRTVRFITDYDLTELSLVDNPANQLANIDSFTKSLFSMTKGVDGSVTDVTGIATDVKIDSVFICNDDLTVLISSDESQACPTCSKAMENAGWFESGDNDRATRVKEIVNKFLNVSDAEAALETPLEGGVTMAKATSNEDKKVPEGTEVGVVNPSEEFSDGTKVEDTVKDDESAPVDEVDGSEETDETASPEEVPVDNESKLEKKIDEFHEAITSSLSEARGENREILDILQKSIDNLNELHERTSDLEKKMDDLNEGLTVAKARQASLEKSLEVLNNSDAVRKSADEEDTRTAEKQDLQKSTWGGAFSGKSRFSIDNHMKGL